MKILFVINSLGSGGAEYVASLMANFWAERGNEVHVVTFANSDTPPFYELSPKVRLTQLGCGLSYVKGIKKIYAFPRIKNLLEKQLKAVSPNVIISFMDQTNILTLWAAKALDIPVIVSERIYPKFSSLLEKTMPLPIRIFAPFLINRMYKRARAIVVQSELSKIYFPKYLRPNIEIIHNPVMPPSKQQSDCKIKAFSIVAIGRLVAQKRFDLLINAFSEVSPHLPDWTLNIFGEGPLREMLQAQIDVLGISDKAHLRGITKTPYAILKEAEIFILTSDYEGFPNALCQAMASKCAVIATDCPTGPSEIISDGLNGSLIPPNDPKILADAMVALMSSADKRKSFQEKAPEILSRFTLEKIMANWDSVIAKCK